MAVLPIIASSLAVLLSLIIFCILHALPTGGSTALSFSVKLIHRDNPESPVYDPTSTPLSRIRAAVQHSVALANYFRNASASANSNSRHLTAVDSESFYLEGMGYMGTFLIELGIGDLQGGMGQSGIGPQFAHLGISTEEGMSFVMCKTKENHDKKDAPFFNPNASATYRTVPCLSDSCNSIRRFPCDSTENYVCKYEDRPYGRHIIISGNLSTETVRLRNTDGGWVSVHGIHFGCTYRMETLPDDGKLGKNRRGIGILGINSHRLSFLSQLHLATNGKLPRKVSYCLSLQKKKVSRMYFGELPPFNEGSHTTPLFVSQFGNRYYLQLEKVGIFFEGETPVHISVNLEEKGSDHGNMLLDSSWPITHTTRRESMFLSKHAVEGIRRQRVEPPPGLHPAIKICYDWKSPDPRELPIVEFTFKNGAIMSTRNLFSVVAKDVICFLLAPANFTLGVRVLGISPQLAHRISIDLEKNELNIYRNNCDS